MVNVLAIGTLLDLYNGSLEFWTQDDNFIFHFVKKCSSGGQWGADWLAGTFQMGLGFSDEKVFL